MSATTDFAIWLEATSDDDFNEIYSLYRCINDEEDYGIYQCSRRGEQLIVSANHIDEALLLASPAAKEAFIGMLEKAHGIDDFGDIEGWHGFHTAMGKDD